MSKFGRFGPLLGTIYVGNTLSKFLIYASRNAEILTCHEVSLKQLSPRPGWVEYDPVEVWKSVVECIEVAIRNLVLLDINPQDIIAVGLTNQRETVVVWSGDTGEVLHNAIAWCDVRCAETVQQLLTKAKNRPNYLKEVCGLVISTNFSAVKIKWIMDNVAGVREAIDGAKCHVGTLDSWILWNLTGGTESGVHMTDVTNASRTMLMNLQTRKWDKSLCSFFQINPHVLPQIRSCAETYGFIHRGPLQGIPIAGCIGDQQAALLGQMCFRAEQAQCTYDEGCFLLVNTGQEIIDSDSGLLSTVAFQLGPAALPFYALEGAVANSGSAVTWLRENLLLETEINQNCHTLVNSMSDSTFFSPIQSSSPFGTTPLVTAATSTPPNSLLPLENVSAGSDVIFIPAFSGIYTPHWQHKARGMLAGLTSHTTARQVVQAAYEATCFQTRQILEALRSDCHTWRPLARLIVGGELMETPFLPQMLADLCNVDVERPQISSPATLGAMLATGLAMNVLSLENTQALLAPPADVHHPTMCQLASDGKYKRWQKAVRMCIRSTDEESDEEKELDPHRGVTNSIPGSLFIVSSFALVIVAEILRIL
ncbi:glycerol kinase [Phlebotomus argentipes]|uniref:glycerol kinase n=1 Tax=Phlebotomus argentipes TaxID=94469 RepID=UPI002892B602|nr:glycerol kinase [Phlebotomus argentipes]